MALLTREDIKAWLASEGFQPEDRDFGVFFRYQMSNVYIEYDEEDDKQFLRVILPCIYEMDENNAFEVLTAANVVDRDRKVIKCFVVDEDVHVAAELLIDECDKLYGHKPGDDATACVVRIRQRTPMIHAALPDSAPGGGHPGHHQVFRQLREGLRPLPENRRQLSGTNAMPYTTGERYIHAMLTTPMMCSRSRM